MKHIFSLIVLMASLSYLHAQVDARMLQHPDVSDSHIVFAYGEAIWTVPKAGGVAIRLTSPKGGEAFPRFSPDGSQIAYNANYDGNTDIYVMPTQGGVPTRVTHHGMEDRLLDWYPDGKALMFASTMHSGKQRFSQIYKVATEGGLPEKLPMAYGEFASLSDNASKIAFTDRTRLFRTWKRYRGGSAADVWIFDLKTMTSENITSNIANDEMPMWHGDKVYYLSDRGEAKRYNIWVYETKSKEHRQLTTFGKYDVHFPAKGPKEMVFEAGGKLYLLDFATEKYTEVEVQISSDMISVRPHKVSAARYLQNMFIAPDGNRVIAEARGELFSLPAAKGFTQNLTQTSGTAERFPAWSPNGRYLAYWSDASGEYELMIRDMKNGETKQITNLGEGYRYNLYWSPDSKKLVFVDQSMKIHWVDRETGAATFVDQDTRLFEGGLRGWEASWSSDSRWIAYSKTLGNSHNAIFLYNTDTKTSTQATGGFYSDMSPCFDTEGKYLYLMTNRSFRPVYSDYDNTWVYPNATQLAVVPLRADVPSPMLPENDTVAIKAEEKKEEKKEEEKEEDKTEEKEEDKGIAIDFEGFERRMLLLPVSAGNYNSLSAAKGKVLYMHYPNSGSQGGPAALKYFDFGEKEEKTIMTGANGYQLSANTKKILVSQRGKFGVIAMGVKKKIEDVLPTKDMEMTVDPRKEWEQIFADAWRFQRDFFYDKDMHGVDWDEMKTRYGSLVPHAVSRADINFILGELIGELDASHTYKGGGDQEYGDRKSVGYLGIDWAKEGDAYKVKSIVRGAPWDTEVRSPLDIPGVDVEQGDFILAVNGIKLADYSDPWAAFEGLANETVQLTVNSSASMEGAREVLVKTLRSETRLRNLAWIDSNRRRVAEASDGKIGYVYVPSTAFDGQNELVRQFYGQMDKEGLIIDERFNNGGQIPDRFIELLNRKPLAFWAVRDGKDWQWPPVANFGSMAMLINGWAGSGGDAFPDYFRKAGLGPLIGDRTWGGLIGISGAPSLVDGGFVTVPTFRMYNPDGTWFKEGHGVEPDILVKEDPTQLAKGVDTQLERAIEEVMGNIRKQGKLQPAKPAKENRSGK